MNHDTIQAAINSLNPEQHRAVDLYERPILVMAPVGTGKTNVVALRAANAIGHGIPARRMLCLSFTNKAAREMRTRLVTLLGKDASEITAATFHGLCASILRMDSGRIGLDSDFLIYDEDDCWQLMESLWRVRNISVAREDIDRFNSLLFQAAAKYRLSFYDEGARLKPEDVFNKLLADSYFKALDKRQNFQFAAIVRDFVASLRENHAVDFADLIVGVNLLFERHAAVLERWRNRYEWIQVDEVQDTNRSEYAILAAMARPHRQFSFFGDIDQTIYEWRGSAPAEILQEYLRDFAPVETIPFVRNYRSTRMILGACEGFIRRCPNAVTKRIQPQVAERGEPVYYFEAATPAQEAEWIAGEIQRLRHGDSLSYRDFAVLTRTNFTARDISEQFTRLNLPHLKVDEYKFFARAEIKAILAHLRLLVNPHDGSSLARFLQTPPKGIGPATLDELRGEPRKAGLRCGDLLSLPVLDAGDPFAALQDSLARGEVVVFDVESTGLDTASDEVIEMFAAKCDGSGVLEQFHRYLRPSRAVGESQAVHGFSDEFLAANGGDPAEVFREFQEFRGAAVLAGHNIMGFDLDLLRSQAFRLGVEFPEPPAAYDTLDLVRRYLRLSRYSLESIAHDLNFKARPTHKASDDVLATVELLLYLLPSIREGEQTRRAAIAKHAKRFLPVARMLEKWRGRMTEDRPPDLLLRILDESGLDEHYRGQEDGDRRLGHLGELHRLFEVHDNALLRPADSLMALLNLASLGSDIDRQAGDADCVLLLTVHQAKGLEFDTVFIAGATDDEFPSRRSKREGRMEEEQRLFYVAMSRARRHLYISWPSINGWRKPQQSTRYLDQIPAEFLQELE
jgi:DNA helicase II / ATP-dependent DNA helicase PcrA